MSTIESLPLGLNRLALAWESVAIAGVFAAGCVVVGNLVYRALQWRLAEAL